MNVLLHVDVIEADIKDGRRNSFEDCMVKRAIDRASEGAFDGLGVGYRGLVYWRRGALVRLPTWVVRKVYQWDLREDVEPFSFDLPLEVPA